MPAATPSGTAVAAVTTMIRIESTQAIRMPAREGSRTELGEVRKRQPSRGRPSISRSISRIASVAIPSSVQQTPSTLNSRSWRLPRAISRSRSLMSVRLPEPLAERPAGEVERQRHQEQHQPGGEDRPVADAAVRQVALADRDDVPRDRRGALARVEGEARLAAGGDRNDHRLPDRPRDAEDVR